MTYAEGVGEGDAGQENLRECWRCLCVLETNARIQPDSAHDWGPGLISETQFPTLSHGMAAELVDVAGAACAGRAWLQVAAGVCRPAPVRSPMASFEEGVCNSTLILCRVFKSSSHLGPLCTLYSGCRVHLSPTRW